MNPAKRVSVADYEGFLADVVHVIDEARRAAARTVNAAMTTAYWLIGRRIVEEEQRGTARADYVLGFLGLRDEYSESQLEDDPPMGLILCAENDHAMAKYALKGLSNTALAAEYRATLPQERLLAEEIARTRRQLDVQRQDAFRALPRTRTNEARLQLTARLPPQ